VTGALAARCLALLGPVDGPLVVLGPHAARLAAGLPAGTRLAGVDDHPAGAIVTFLGSRGDSTDRRNLLADLRGRLPPGAPLVLLDHNQPRAWWRRALGAVALALRGLPPGRARYPAARELAALGFDVERMRFARGEQVQLVAGRRRPCGPPRECVQSSERGPWQ
jgi:hypothetical protein